MKKQKRTKEIHARLSEAELARVQVSAKAAGKSVGAFMRDAALNENGVHIKDGNKLALKLERLRNQMQVYHTDISGRLRALENAIDYHSTLMKTFGSEMYFTPEARQYIKIVDICVESAVNTIRSAYSEYENRAEEALHSMLTDNSRIGGV